MKGLNKSDGEIMSLINTNKNIREQKHYSAIRFKRSSA